MKTKQYGFCEKFAILSIINLIACSIKLLFSNIYVMNFATCLQIIYIVMCIKAIYSEEEEH